MALSEEISSMKIINDERCMEYAHAGHPERPSRIRGTLELLRSQTELPIQWAAPVEAEETVIVRAHSEEHIARLNAREDFDGDTPDYPAIEDHARRSLGGALAA